MTGLNIEEKAIKQLLDVNSNDWLNELNGISEFFGQFGDRLPRELWDEYTALKERLQATGV